MDAKIFLLIIRAGASVDPQSMMRWSSHWPIDRTDWLTISPPTWHSGEHMWLSPTDPPPQWVTWLFRFRSSDGQSCAECWHTSRSCPWEHSEGRTLRGFPEEGSIPPFYFCLIFLLQNTLVFFTFTSTCSIACIFQRNDVCCYWQTINGWWQHFFRASSLVNYQYILPCKSS